METWDVIMTILVIINVVAFASAVGASYDTWKASGKIDWQTPLMGLFFLPLCVVLLFAWPYYLYKENKIKQLEAQRIEEIKKRREETKKFHFEKFGFRLKNLPFMPVSDEIIYVENEYDERINSLVSRNKDYIRKCLEDSEYFKSKFVYLPCLAEELLGNAESIGYMAPYLKERNIPAKPVVGSSSLLDFMANPENRSKITPCFARYCGKQSDGCYLYECVGFNPEENIDEEYLFKCLCMAFDHFPTPVGPAYQTRKLSKEEIEKQDADERFGVSSKQLLKEIEEKIGLLRKMGVSQWVLDELVKPEQRLSRLVVTKDYRLLLPDYNNMEIKMEPLVKAVFLLFLKHPEGIMFKYLPDYREELMQIYVKLKPNGLNDRALQSIEDVTNPLLNSINEKCARIRGAFVREFDDHMARHYYIDGSRGEAKKIALPRELVVWEEEMEEGRWLREEG